MKRIIKPFLAGQLMIWAKATDRIKEGFIEDVEYRELHIGECCGNKSPLGWDGHVELNDFTGRR